VSRARAPSLGLLLALQFAFGVAFSIFLLLPKILATTLHAGPEGIGLVGSMFAFAGVAAVPFVGARVDRAGRPRLMAGGTLLMLGASLAFLAVDRVGPLALALRAAHGFAYTVVFAVGAALAADLSPPDRMARTMGLYGSANLITNAVAPAFGEPLLDAFGPRAVYLAAAAMSLVAYLLARRIVELPAAGVGPTGGLSVVLRRGRAVRSVLAVTAAGVGVGVMFNFSQPLALALGAHEVRSFFIAYTLAVLLVRFGLAGVTDRVGPQRAHVGALVLYSVVVFSMRFLAASGPLGLPTFGFAFGVAHGFLFPAAMALSVADLPASERGRMLTLVNGAFVGGTALVMPLGVVAAHAGYVTVFTLAAGVTAAAAVMLARWPVGGPGAVP
jgi:MFS family permease